MISTLKEVREALKHSIKWLNIADMPRECIPVHEALTKLDALIAQVEKAEPVGINGLTEAETNASMSVRGLSKPAAPSTSPLTYEQISSLWDGHTVPVFGRTGINPIVFARAIEAAHGIGAKPHVPETNFGNIEPHTEREVLGSEMWQVAENLRIYGLGLVRAENGYTVIKLGQLDAHGIGAKP